MPPSRTDVVRRLNERLPSFRHLVASLAGDVEALQMSTWERQVDYLAERLAPGGRVADLCCGAGVKSALLARTVRVIAVDILEDRLLAARENARLFGVSDAVEFKRLDLSEDGALSELGDVDAILVDPDWRENVSAPIVRHSPNPLRTSPPTDTLYRAIRHVYSDTPVIFEVSPRADPNELALLGNCLIEEIHINGRFVLYHVSFLRGLRSLSRRVVRL